MGRSSKNANFIGQAWNGSEGETAGSSLLNLGGASNKLEAGMQTGLTSDEIANIVVSKPQEYSLSEAIVQLRQRAEGDERYASIVENQNIYPEKLLINLANNPELISFVADYTGQDLATVDGVTVAKDSHGPASGDTLDDKLTDAELAQECPLFLQWDKRWGYHAYGDDSTISVSGCGPTSLAMVVVGLEHDKSVTPAAVADFAMDNDYYMAGTGTMWSLMTEGAAHYGLDSTQIDIDRQQMEQCLESDGMLICSMAKGDFTTAGHFIVIYDKGDEGFIVNDPFCIYRSTQEWSFEQLQGQLKSVWAVYA